jgi:ribosomal protein L12E/L44/L45/RPP1/RPP2
MQTANEKLLIHALKTVLQDLNSEIDYETMNFAIHTIALVSGKTVDEVSEDLKRVIALPY